MTSPPPAAASPEPLPPSLLEHHLVGTDTGEHIYSFLDVPALVGLAMTSHDLCSHAKAHIMSITSEAVRYTHPTVPGETSRGCFPFRPRTPSSMTSSSQSRRHRRRHRNHQNPQQESAFRFLRPRAGSSRLAQAGAFLARPFRLLFFGRGTPPNPRPRTAMALLIQQLPSFPNLSRLSLEYRGFRCDDAQALTQVLATHPSCGAQLESLNVSYNLLRKEGARALGVCLRHLPALSELLLNDNSIYGDAASALCSALRSGACPRLRRFSLAWNWIGVLGSRELGALLGSGACKELRRLDLRGNGITSVGLCMLLEALMESAKAAASAAGVGGNNENEQGEGEEEEGNLMWPSMLQHHYFHFDPTTKKQQLPVASPCPLLEELNLSHNYCGGEGVRAMAKAMHLGVFPLLKSLTLTHNSVDEESAALLQAACGGHCKVFIK